MACRRLLLAALLGLSSGHGSVPSRPAVHSLRGGDADLTIRVRTRSGTIRTKLQAESTLTELQRLLQKEHKLPLSRQRISRAAGGGQPLDADADGATTLKELGIVHGVMLHLELTPDPKSVSTAAGGDEGAPSESGASAAPAPPARSVRSTAGRRARGTTMADYTDAKAAQEVVLEVCPHKPVTN